MTAPVSGHLPGGELGTGAGFEFLGNLAFRQSDFCYHILHAFGVAAGAAIDAEGGETGGGLDFGGDVVGAEFAAGDIDAGPEAVMKMQGLIGEVSAIPREVLLIGKKLARQRGIVAEAYGVTLDEEAVIYAACDTDAW